ncbi:beta-amylase 7 isoform X2 [Daucus carota subsp. sativus]|uniref:beta-amylase 7 isoform X2 n=1 Tax=Daucus carota subsp. sativus TaxID=79200 RepID=UPI003083C508
MSSEMQKFQTSEDDDDEMGMDVKEEDDEDEDDDDKNTANQVMVGVEGGFTSTSSNNRFQQNQQYQEQLTPQGGSRRCRPMEEKERTKLRERQRRAITAKILTGLRRHGNYNLRVRADINDVIAALAREAGWVVLPDGTTFPSRSQGTKPAAVTPTTVVTSSSTQMTPQQTSPASLGGMSSSYQSTVEYNACQMKDIFVPSSSPYDVTSNAPSQTSALLVEGLDVQDDPIIGGSMDAVDNRQLGVINMKCELVDPDSLLNQLRFLKAINVDGVVINAWWGIVEAHGPQVYNWSGYKRLFQVVRDLKLKLQVVLCFHECGGNLGDDVIIPLPNWVAEIGLTNPDIYFTDRAGRRNQECLSWGIDKERVLRGRTAVEVYFDYMRSFRTEFDLFFEDGTISLIEIGLGPCGELRYPSNPVKHGWRYPGVGEFQCYDQYLLKSLRRAAETRGHSFWARGPDNSGSYNSQPKETGFFCDGGDYNGHYGRFFLGWYSQVLIDHGDRLMALARMAFEGICIAAKLSGIYWWYKSSSHAAELTAGFYNPCNRDGYAPIMAMLRKHEAGLNFTCVGTCMLVPCGDFSGELGDPEGLNWQVLNAAWDALVPVSSENDLPCHDRDGYNRILEKAKPLNDPDGRHFTSFTYLSVSLLLMERQNFMEFERFVKKMHGEAVLDV